tara:strand:+ start:213 stop:500 length:288 start_codon:yes stop_codon:yes gene_type:complete
MPKLRKAARGKHRYLGLSLPEQIPSRDSLDALLVAEIPDGAWYKMYDFRSGSAIIKVALKDYEKIREWLSGEPSGVTSLTSSGKLRLVRERIYSE